MNNVVEIKLPQMCNPDSISDIAELRSQLHRANASLISHFRMMASMSETLHNMHKAIDVLVKAHDAADYVAVNNELGAISERYRKASRDIESVKETGRWPQSAPAPAPVREPMAALRQLDTDRLNHLAKMDHCIIGFVNGTDASCGTIEEVKLVFENLNGSPADRAIRAALDVSMLIERQQTFGSLH